ncbi:transposase [Accumulibacter sp.]|jgi:IS5 family transposase|uniref:transposase n=1 Tax=Accumulibacter sp. TaxID=2053492 RepID=UPI00339065F1
MLESPVLGSWWKVKSDASPDRRGRFAGLRAVAYAGVEKREDLKDRDIDWQVATRHSKLKATPKESKLGPLLRRLKSVKASVRSKVKHPFHIVKNLFGHRKVRYEGLNSNTAQLHILSAPANLVITKRQVLALHSQGAS